MMTPERTRLRADVVVAGKQRETGPRVPHTVLNVDLNEQITSMRGCFLRNNNAFQLRGSFFRVRQATTGAGLHPRLHCKANRGCRVCMCVCMCAFVHFL